VTYYRESSANRINWVSTNFGCITAVGRRASRTTPMDHLVAT